MSLLRSFRSFERTFERTFRGSRSIDRLSTRANARAVFLPFRQFTIASSSFNTVTRRYHSTDETPESRAPRPLTDRSQEKSPEEVSAQQQSDADDIAMRKALSPAYQLWFTCKKCLERSGHTISKQAYHFGTCVINCPKCKSQHLISDNLKIFSDKNMTLEDIAKEHGQHLRKGKLGVDGDIEFYTDRATKTVMDAQARQEEIIKSGEMKDG